MTLAELQHEVGVRVNSDPNFISSVLSALDSMLELQLKKTLYGGCFYDSSLPFYTGMMISLSKLRRELYPMYDTGPIGAKADELSIRLGNTIARAKQLRREMRLCGCPDCRKEFQRWVTARNQSDKRFPSYEEIRTKGL